MKLKSILLIISLLISTIAIQAQEKAKDHYKAGSKNFKKSLFVESIDGFTKAIEMDNNYTDAYFYRAQAYSKTNQPEKAIADYDAVNKLDNTNIEAWLSNGNINYDLKNYAKAAEKYAQYLASENKDLSIFGKQIESLYAIKEWQKALHYAKLSLAVSNLVETNYKIGELEFILKNYKGAEVSFRAALVGNPNHINARNDLAKALFEQGRYDEAIREANAVMAISKDNKTAYLTRVYSYHKKLEIDKAINDLSKIILIYKTDDNYLDLVNYRADMYLEFSQHMNAINDYSSVIIQDPENVYALYKRAKAYDVIGRKDVAILDYTKVVRLADNKEIITDYLSDSKSRLFELKRENNRPVISIKNENFANDEIRVTFVQKEAELKIAIQEDSDIEELNVSGGQIINQYNADGKNIVPRNNKGELEYLAMLDLTDRDAFSITAKDVYGNATTTNYTIKRIENTLPEISFTVPYTDDNYQVMLDGDKAVVYFEGTIKDESLIKSITFNGAIITFKRDEKNPGFKANIDIKDQSKITVQVIDIYDNVLNREYYLNREGGVLSDNNPMGKTWVVFIENSNYESFASLEGPVKDIRLMRSALSDYQVHNFLEKSNMTKAQMDRFFSIELRDIVKRERINSLVIWYAGHGKFLNETGYWIPVDADRTDEFSYFNINNLKASMQVYANELTHTLVITDACESGPSFYMAMRADPEIKSCFDESATKFKSSQVFSSAGYELASDNSQFTKTFANTLINDSKQCVPIESVVLKVTDAVVNENQQKPQFGKIAGFADENGTFFFIKKQAEITPEAIEKMRASFSNNPETREFESKRESNMPVIVIKNDNFANDEIQVTLDQTESELKILVQEESNIEAITVDGGKIIDQFTDAGQIILPLNKQGDYEYLAKLDLTNRSEFTVTVKDVYGNATSAIYSIKRVKKILPNISFVLPIIDENNQIFLKNDMSVVSFEGNIKNESLIKSIAFNGANIPFNNEEKNPGFSTSIDIQAKEKITVEVTDVNNNVLSREYSLNRENVIIKNSNPMGKTWVVFIENSNYKSFTSLDDPVKDVKLIESALSKYQVDSILHVSDMTKAQMAKFFAVELRNIVEQNEINSLLIWYAGHGKLLNNVGYWIPVDGDRTDEFSYFNINNLKASMQVYANNLSHTLVITDACESSPFFYQSMEADPEIKNCSDETAVKFKSSQVFSSAGYELGSDKSSFTKTFSSSLINASKQCVPIEAIVLKVTEAVINENQPKPQFGKIDGFADENGTFFFIKK